MSTMDKQTLNGKAESLQRFLDDLDHTLTDDGLSVEKKISLIEDAFDRHYGDMDDVIRYLSDR